jgi:prepilin-type N-terminal cleavage/methylation domain-containing protein
MSKQGFTLIEMLVSIGILAVIIVIAVGIYVYAIGSQQKSTANANLQEDGQNILSMISKDLRATRVDYSFYGGAIPSPTSTLALVDDYSSATTSIVYTYNSAAKQVKRCKQVSAACDAPGKFEVMNMTNVLVQRLDFYISPSSSPYTTGVVDITSTRVTIIMDLTAQQERFGQKAIRLQQTINPRYELKQ